MASTYTSATGAHAIDNAFEENVVFPAVFLSLWSYQVATMTGGCAGCTCARW